MLYDKNVINKLANQSDSDRLKKAAQKRLERVLWLEKYEHLEKKVHVKLRSPDAYYDADFGRTIAIDGDRILAGSQFELNGGSIYLFERRENRWEKIAKLKNMKIKIGVSFYFGCSADISGDYIIVGARRSQNAKDSKTPPSFASAYIFHYDPGNPKWSNLSSLVKVNCCRDCTTKNSLTAVAISGVYAVLASTDGVCVFKRKGDQWTRVADIQTEGGCGAVAMPGDYIIAGQGYLAEIFKREGDKWIRDARLSTAKDGSSFGHSVSISGDYAAVSYWVEEDRQGKSFIIVYKRSASGWNEGAILQVGDVENYTRGAPSVSISGDHVIAGVWDDNPYDNDNAFPAGAAYVFKRDGEKWDLSAWLKAADMGSQDRFGCAVAISEKYAVIGARMNDGKEGECLSTSCEDMGAAYIYPLH